MPVSGNLKYYASIASQDTNAVESFFGSEITIQGTAVILPAGLIEFNANIINDKDVNLQWKVANTNLAVRYEIGRSNDGMQFIGIGSVNATLDYRYNFYDNHHLAGRSHYRLRMISADNQNNFSSIASIFISSAIAVTRVTTSPAHDYFVVKTKAAGQHATLTDMQGKNLINLFITDGVKVNIANIPAGLYLLKLNDGEVIKFIKN